MNQGNAVKQAAGAVMVVGGGVAGVQAALDLAESGYQVYLVEKGPALGGVMMQLDKTFPTNCNGCWGCRAQHNGMAQLDETLPVNDCALCIPSPKLVESGCHANIRVLKFPGQIAPEGTQHRLGHRPLNRHLRR